MNKLKTWLYKLYHGHLFLLDEEVDIIIKTRAEERYKWMNDRQIQNLIKGRIKQMYINKFGKH